MYVCATGCLVVVSAVYVLHTRVYVHVYCNTYRNRNTKKNCDNPSTGHPSQRGHHEKSVWEPTNIFLYRHTLGSTPLLAPTIATHETAAYKSYCSIQLPQKHQRDTADFSSQSNRRHQRGGGHAQTHYHGVNVIAAPRHPHPPP